MLNDNTEAESLLASVKGSLEKLFHSEGSMYDGYKEMFKEEPNPRVKQFLGEIGVPLIKLKKMYEMIQYVTTSLKERMSEYDLNFTNHYLDI